MSAARCRAGQAMLFSHRLDLDSRDAETVC